MGFRDGVATGTLDKAQAAKGLFMPRQFYAEDVGVPATTGFTEAIQWVGANQGGLLGARFDEHAQANTNRSRCWMAIWQVREYSLAYWNGIPAKRAASSSAG